MEALREEHEAERSRLNQEASGLQDQVAALSDTMEALQGQHEQTTRELQSKSAVLNQIYNSHGWKALSIYYNLRSEEHTSELQSHLNLVCRLLLEKKKN